MESQKQAVCYFRVSTARQVAEGVSMEAQRERLRAWCKAMGFEVAGEYSDRGISGKRADNRPGLQRALDRVCKERGALIVYSLSRLARSTKDALAISERLDKAGADLVSLSENIDTTTAAGKMVFRMLAVLSEFERDLVGERTAAALAHMRSNGYKTGGHCPFGFDVDDDGRLVENPKEQLAIAFMRQLREQGFSLRRIGTELEARGIKTRTGGRWQSSTLKKILDRAA